MKKESSDLLILIAEDDETIHTFFVQCLIACGCQKENIEVVGDGQLALARLLSGAIPDLLITDMQMGGGDQDGDVLITAIKTHPRLHALPVGLYSTRTEEADPALHRHLRQHRVPFLDKAKLGKEEVRQFMIRILGQ